ncbi:hypothetical protein SLEP1_g42538 [Rubroshorea leprosula]|uniref:Uncharacterized protein n=1 Tax=Rubroshorea leprosula TaxID=152421 RepID=A0AAV5LAM8_9ROSI|nr:hypothetical protein SLEP1_g42538 [Rubroshorea leprosula]
MYVPGSLYAICRAPPSIDGLRGWRMRSHAYSMYHPMVYLSTFAGFAERDVFCSLAFAAEISLFFPLMR